MAANFPSAKIATERTFDPSNPWNFCNPTFPVGYRWFSFDVKNWELGNDIEKKTIKPTKHNQVITLFFMNFELLH